MQKHGHFEYHLAIDPYYHYEVMKRFRVDVHIRDDDVINYVHIPPRGDVFATEDEQDENTAVKFRLGARKGRNPAVVANCKDKT